MPTGVSRRLLAVPLPSPATSPPSHPAASPRDGKVSASLIECKGFDARDQMRRCVKWWREGYMSSTGYCFDIGNTTAEALGAFQRTGNPFAGPTDPAKAGNGSLMRLAPVPMFY